MQQYYYKANKTSLYNVMDNNCNHILYKSQNDHKYKLRAWTPPNNATIVLQSKQSIQYNIMYNNHITIQKPKWS